MMSSVKEEAEAIYCANGCGFFGTAEKKKLCSKCYEVHYLKEAIVKSMSKLSVSVEDEKNKDATNTSVPVPEAKKRCSWYKCNKKVGLLGFSCKCKMTFCGSHRYPEDHNCTFPHKLADRLALAKANPLILPDKLLHKL